MQISKEKFDAMEESIEALSGLVDREREKSKDLEARVIAENRILEKIVAVANGWPMTNDRNRGMSPGMNYSGPEHRCIPFTEEELRQGEVEGLREQVMMLAERLAAVKAVAEFAMEHKL